MAKRVATTQISDRNPYPSNDSSDSEGEGGSSQQVDAQEISRRKISRPRSLLSRGNVGATGGSRGKVPSLGGLFADLPKNPFNASASTSAAAAVPSLADNMRGLNQSFMEAAKKALQRDPAADFSKLFSQYSHHLASFNNLTAKSEPAPESEHASETSEASEEDSNDSDVMIVEQSSPAKQLKQPLTFGAETRPFTFGTSASVTEAEAKPFAFNPAPSADTDTEAKSSFTFGTSASESKPFTFGSATSESKPFTFGSATSETKPFTFGSATATTETKPFTFGSTTSETKPFAFSAPTTATTEKSKPFTFGTSEESASTQEQSKPFTFGSAAAAAAADESQKEGTPKPFSFGLAPAKPKETKAPEATSEAESGTEASKDENEKAAGEGEQSKPGFTFGTSEAKPFSFGSSEAKPFSFGSTTEAKPFSFGSTTEQLKPFSFGSTTALPAFNLNATPFSFSAATTTTPTTTTAAANSDAEDSEIPAEEAESFTLTRTSSEQLKTGAGEENEACQHEERCKIYMLNNQTKEWVDLGVGVFKINRFKNAEGKSRILCRAEGSGKVTLNVLITAKGTEANLPEGKKELALMCVGPNGLPEKYLVRVKTVEQAVALHSALKTEIIYVQSFKS